MLIFCEQRIMQLVEVCGIIVVVDGGSLNNEEQQGKVCDSGHRYAPRAEPAERQGLHQELR